MKFNIHSKDIRFTDKMKKTFVESLRSNVGKIINLDDESVLILGEVAKTKSQKTGKDLYRAELKLNVSGRDYYSDEESDSIYKSIDKVTEEVLRMVKKDHTRGVKLRKRGGTQAKKILKNI